MKCSITTRDEAFNKVCGDLGLSIDSDLEYKAIIDLMCNMNKKGYDEKVDFWLEKLAGQYE